MPAYCKIKKMNRNLLSALLFLFGILLLTACQKELNFSYSNSNTAGSNGGTAQFKFAGGTNSCSGVIVNGTYNNGTALNDKNTIQLKITVDSVGTYTIATANINGVIFSSSGEFTASGAQTIILKGSGTPAAAGNFNFIPGASGCVFPINFTATGTGNAQFTLNGSPDSCLTPIVSGEYKVGTALNGADSVVVKVTVITPGSYSLSTNTNNGIIFLSSGTFSTSGQHTITLTGSGKPLSAGSFTFTPGTNGCKFAIGF